MFVFFLVLGGSTVLVVSQGIESIGAYILQVLPMSLQTGVGDEQWMAGWTIFYWAWWISWAPFVGMFVARISRGRTIREFVLGVVAAPTGFGFLWFAIVGGTGIELQRTGEADIVGSLATPELSLFTALDVLPFPVISSALCVFLIALFFISGADAAAIVMATMASRGSLEPSKIVVVVLGVLMGGIACAMLLVGGLTALQQAADARLGAVHVRARRRRLVLDQGAARGDARRVDGGRRGPEGRARSPASRPARQPRGRARREARGSVARPRLPGPADGVR